MIKGTKGSLMIPPFDAFGVDYLLKKIVNNIIFILLTKWCTKCT